MNEQTKADWHTVKFFLSSTFLDFEQERDQISSLFHSLEREHRYRGISLRPYDLRWFQRRKEQDLLDWCLKQVKSCPYFIGILGYRYGYRPELAPDGSLNTENISITEFEIRYALSKVKAENRIFFVLDDPSVESTNDLEALMARSQLLDLLQESGEQIFLFRSVKELNQLLRKELTIRIDRDYPIQQIPRTNESLSYQERAKKLLSEKSDGFVSRASELAFLSGFIEGSEFPSKCLLSGFAGSGKTALFGELLLGQKCLQIPTVFCSSLLHGASCNARSFWICIAEQLREYGVSGNFDSMALQDLKERCLGFFLACKENFLLCIDGLEGYDFSEQQFFQWFERVPSCVRFLVNCRNSVGALFFEECDGWQSYVLAGLEDWALDEMLVSMLKSSGSEMSPLERVDLCSAASGSPLFLKVSIDEILLSGQAIGQLASNIDLLFEQIVERMSKCLGEKLVSDFLGLLAATRSGLMVEDLVHLLSVEFSEVMSLQVAFGNYLMKTGLRIRFFHLQYQKKIRMLYGQGQIRAYHRMLADYFDSLGESSGLYFDELPYQLLWARESEKFLHLLSSFEFLEQKCRLCGLDSLLEDFELSLEIDAVAISNDVRVEISSGVWMSRRLLFLLWRALRFDAAFLRLHPSALFQSLWNRCYWHDCSELRHFVVEENQLFSEQDLRQTSSFSNSISRLVEYWRKRRKPNPWIRSSRPYGTRLDSPLLDSFQKHKGAIYALVVSPCGSFFVTASKDCSIKICDSESGAVLGELLEHRGQVMSLAIEKSGRFLVSGSYDRTVRIWDLRKLKQIHCLEGHSDWVWRVTYCPKSKQVASASRDKSIRLWDAETGLFLRCLTGHSGEVFTLEFSPDGKSLLSGGQDCSVRMWDASSGVQTRVWLHNHPITSLAYHPSGLSFAFGSKDRCIYVWDLLSKKRIHKLRGHQERICGLRFSLDGDMLGTASYDREIRVWSYSTGDCLHRYQGHDAAVYDVAFHPDGRRLYSASYDRKVCVWDITDSSFSHEVIGHKAWIKRISWSPSKRFFVSCGQDKVVGIWSAQTGYLLHLLEGGGADFLTVAISPDESSLLAADGKGFLYFWKLQVPSGDSCEAMEVSGHFCVRVTNCAIFDLQFSAQGESFSFTKSDGTVQVESLLGSSSFFKGKFKPLIEQSEEQNWQIHSGAGLRVAWHPKKSVIASSDFKGNTVLLDSLAGEHLHDLPTLSSMVDQLSFSKCGSFLFLGTLRSGSMVWDLKSKRVVLKRKNRGDIERLNQEVEDCGRASGWRADVKPFGTSFYRSNQGFFEELAFPLRLGGLSWKNEQSFIAYVGQSLYAFQLMSN